MREAGEAQGSIARGKGETRVIGGSGDLRVLTKICMESVFFSFACYARKNCEILLIGAPTTQLSSSSRKEGPRSFSCDVLRRWRLFFTGFQPSLFSQPLFQVFSYQTRDKTVTIHSLTHDLSPYKKFQPIITLASNPAPFVSICGGRTFVIRLESRSNRLLQKKKNLRLTVFLSSFVRFVHTLLVLYFVGL